MTGPDVFADVVNELLADRDWSRRELARAVDVDPAHVSRVLGKAGRPASPRFMESVARTLGVSPELFSEYREWLVVEAVRRDPNLRERIYARLREAA